MPVENLPSAIYASHEEQQGLELRSRVLAFAVAAPIVLTIAYGLLTI